MQVSTLWAEIINMFARLGKKAVAGQLTHELKPWSINLTDASTGTFEVEYNGLPAGIISPAGVAMTQTPDDFIDAVRNEGF